MPRRRSKESESILSCLQQAEALLETAEQQERVRRRGRSPVRLAYLADLRYRVKLARRAEVEGSYGVDHRGRE